MTADYSYTVHGQIVRCRADETLKSYVDAFAQALARVPSEHFHDEAVLRIGWSTYKLVTEDEAIVVTCPDFAEEVNDWVRDLSLALSVDAQQAHVLSLAGVADGTPALFNEKVVYAEGVFESAELVAQRTEPGKGADSGWYFGIPGEDSPAEKLRATNVYKLLRYRPSLLRALALPHGYLAAFTGDEIDVILDASDNVAFERKAAESTPSFPLENMAIAGKALGLSMSEVAQHSSPVEGMDAMYVWSPVRGGGSLIIDSTGEMLFANSSIDIEQHREAFRSGRRTDPAVFDS